MAHLPDHLLERRWPPQEQAPRRVRRGAPQRAIVVPASLSLGRFGLAFLAMFFVTGAFVVLLAAPREHLRGGPAVAIERQLLELRGSGAQACQLHGHAARLYGDAGRYGEAARHFGAMHGLAPEDSAEAGEALLWRGIMRLRQGRLEDARHDLEKALALAERRGSSQALILQMLGSVRRDMGHLGTALELYTRALDMAKAEGSEDDRAFETDIGEVHARRGELQHAEAHLKAALRHDERVDAEDIVFGVSLSSMGNVYHWQGDVKRAIEHYRKALRIQQSALRPDHPDLIVTRMSLARALRDSGDAQHALQSATAVEQTLRSGAQEGPDLSRALILKADLLREQGRFPEAERSIREAMQRQSDCFGTEEHPDVAIASNTFGSILHDQGKLQLAFGYYSQALRINKRTVGAKHPEVAATHNIIGTLQVDLGDYDAAELHFRKCLEIQSAAVGPGNPELGNTLNNLATVLFRTGQRSEAAVLLQRALDMLDSAGVPAANPDRLIYANNLAKALADQEKEETEEEDEEKGKRPFHLTDNQATPTTG